MSPPPLWVAVIVPTGDRRILVDRAVHYFERQTYPWRKLVVVDGSRENRGRYVDLYLRDRSMIEVSPDTTLGERRNVACEAAASCDLIAHFDDDDYYAPNYLEQMVVWFRQLQRSSAPVEIIGLKDFYTYDFFRRNAWKGYSNATGPAGPTLVYSRTFWKEHHFPHINRGEDNELVRAASADHVVGLSGTELFVYMRHWRNVTGHVDGLATNEHASEVVRAMLSATFDLEFYDRLSELVPAPPLGSDWHLPAGVRLTQGGRR